MTDLEYLLGNFYDFTWKGEGEKTDKRKKSISYSHLN